MAEQDEALRRGEVVDSTITLAEWADQWFESWKILKRPKRATVQANTAHVRKVKDALGHRRLVDLRRSHIRKFVEQNLEFDVGNGGRPISPNTVALRLYTLKAILEYAVEEGKLRENPAARMKKPAHVPFVPEPITRAMLDDILTAAESHPWLLPVIYMDVQTGLRIGELCGLRWNKWDRSTGAIRIDTTLRYVGELYEDTPKSKAGIRTMPLGGDLAAFLEDHQRRQKEQFAALGLPWSDEAHIFCNSRGRPLDGKVIYRAFKRVVRHLGYGKLRVHDLRHAFGTYMAANKTHLKTVQNLMGHANASQTLHYSHASDEMKREAMDDLGRTFA